jgi:hypothetical protein
MLISEKQHAANRQNAQHSTGPKTPEGKAAVRFNALTFTLRAQHLILPHDNPEDYQQLWNNLEAEWQPQTDAERHFMDQMCESDWLLTRNAYNEKLVYAAGLQLEKRLALVNNFSVLRVRLQRSYTTAMREIQQLQAKRRAQPQPQPVQLAQTAPTAQPAAPSSEQPPAQHPAYIMSEGAEAPPIVCAPATTDTR